MRSLTPEYLDSRRLTVRQASVMRALGEFCGKQALHAKRQPETLEALRTVAVVESTEASNRLEGITASDARIKALVQRSARPRNRSEQEIAGYRDALDLIHKSASEMAVSVNVLLQLHSTIYRYLQEDGGRWKRTDNEIVERGRDGEILRVRFRALPAAGTPEAVSTLVDQYGRAVQESRDPLVVVPLAVLDFLCIHPFRDGNGRVARLLTILLLYHAGYEVGRYISLERLFEESRESYYETLEASSRGWHEGTHDVVPWMEYFWGVLTRAYKEFEQRVGSIPRGRGSKSQRVREAVLRQVRPFRITEIEDECPDISRETIRVVLRELKSEGRIIAEGRGPGARWRLE